MDTKGNGGRELRKTIVVYTNEASASQRTLSIRGRVEAVYTVTARRIDLRGTVGTTITASATLVPAEKYPFTVTGVKALGGKYIDVFWKQQKKERQIEYILNVKNLKKERGRYTDTIIVETDSVTLPQIRIGVYGNISG